MRISRFTVVCLSLVATAAFGQNNRSFVSIAGNDANNCTAGNECRSFVHAISVTNPGGEIIAITSGGYGPFTVSGAMTVMAAPGVSASITSSSSDAIDVGAGSSDTVLLRGLSITVAAPHVGIYAYGFGTLSVERCYVKGGNLGIVVGGPSGSLGIVEDSVVVGAGAGFGIQSRTLLNRCRANSSTASGVQISDGIGANGAVNAVDLISSGNGGNGVYAFSQTDGHNVEVNLDHAVLTNNGQEGVFVGTISNTNASVVGRISNCFVTDNGDHGLFVGGGGTLDSMNNNVVAGNTNSDTQGAIGTITVH